MVFVAVEVVVVRSVCVVVVVAPGRLLWGCSLLQELKASGRDTAKSVVHSVSIGFITSNIHIWLE